jgi:hypothetical protein
MPRSLRGLEVLRRLALTSPAGEPKETDPQVLSSLIRAEAARIGMTAVGLTAYDARYTYAHNAGTHDEGSVILCVQEEDWLIGQSAPSRRHERETHEM